MDGFDLPECFGSWISCLGPARTCKHQDKCYAVWRKVLSERIVAEEREIQRLREQIAERRLA